jgi:hypothetical protein
LSSALRLSVVSSVSGVWGGANPTANDFSRFLGRKNVAGCPKTSHLVTAKSIFLCFHSIKQPFNYTNYGGGVALQLQLTRRRAKNCYRGRRGPHSPQG